MLAFSALPGISIQGGNTEDVNNHKILFQLLTEQISIFQRETQYLGKAPVASSSHERYVGTYREQ